MGAGHQTWCYSFLSSGSPQSTSCSRSPGAQELTRSTPRQGTGLCSTTGMDGYHHECHSSPAEPSAVCCCPLLGCSYKAQLMSHLGNSLESKPVVFQWFGSLNRFSTKMGTEGERVKEEVEQRRRKGSVPGHNSQTLGHLNCTQWVQFGIWLLVLTVPLGFL